MGRTDRDLVARFWSRTPWRALFPLLAAVFCTSTAIGFLVDVANVGRMQPRLLAAIVLFSGLVAVAFALIAIRRRYWLFAPVIVLQVLVPRWLEHRWPETDVALQGDALRHRLVADAGGALVGLALGYAFWWTRSSWRAGPSGSWPTCPATGCRRGRTWAS